MISLLRTYQKRLKDPHTAGTALNQEVPLFDVADYPPYLVVSLVNKILRNVQLFHPMGMTSLPNTVKRKCLL